MDLNTFIPIDMVEPNELPTVKELMNSVDFLQKRLKDQAGYSLKYIVDWESKTRPDRYEVAQSSIGIYDRLRAQLLKLISHGDED